MPSVPDKPWRLRAYITFGAWGWSEVYWLAVETVAEALTVSRDLLNRRRLWFGRNVSLEYACVCRGSECLDTWAVDLAGISTFPPRPFPLPQPPNDRSSGLEYRLEADFGRWLNRLFKGVPDDWIESNRRAGPATALQPLGEGFLPQIVLEPAAPGGTAAVRLQPRQTLQLLQRSFLDVLMLYTGFSTTPAQSPGGQSWTVEPIQRILFRQVGNKPSSHPFRRVSCESLSVPMALGWADPPFAFCGQCVGVARTCYIARCVWSDDGPNSLIRFYYIPRTNPLYYGQLRFGPKISEPGYRNTVGVGELTTHARTWFRGTNRYPARDGTHPLVTPLQAAGEDVWPDAWVDGMPTAFLPTCDYPAPPRRRAYSQGYSRGYA